MACVRQTSVCRSATRLFSVGLIPDEAGGSPLLNQRQTEVCRTFLWISAGVVSPRQSNEAISLASSLTRHIDLAGVGRFHLLDSTSTRAFKTHRLFPAREAFYRTSFRHERTAALPGHENQHQQQHRIR